MSEPDDVEIYRRAEGVGPVVLLGHGFGGSARNFRPQSRALRDRYRVVSYDARGHARSGAPHEAAAYRAPCLVGDVARLLDDERCEAAVVGGLSLGAAIALDFALAHPDRVRALVLAAFPADPSEAVVRAALAFADSIDAEGLEAAGERHVWGPDSGLDVRGAAFVRQGFLEHPPWGLAHILREYLARRPRIEALEPALRELAVPTLIVVGDRDAPSVGSSQALARLLPDSELARIEDAGHVVNLQRPEAFNAQLQAFLGRVLHAAR